MFISFREENIVYGGNKKWKLRTTNLLYLNQFFSATSVVPLELQYRQVALVKRLKRRHKVERSRKFM
jgi:hypothetical protein